MEVPCQHHALAAYRCGKSHWHPLKRKWAETHSQSECFGEEINLLTLLRFKLKILQTVA